VNVALRRSVERRGRETRGGVLPSRRGPAVAGWFALAGAAILLVGCYVVGRRLQADGYRLFTLLPPLTGRVDQRLPVAAAAPTTVGLVVLRLGPTLARRLAWHPLLAVAGLTALAWSLALAAVDGADGFLGPVLSETDYLAVLPSIDAPGPFLERFVEAIASYPTHVRAHPPGLVVGLWWLDRVGLGGAGWIAALQHGAAAAAVPAVMLAVRDVTSVSTARKVAPFLALSPAAVAIGSGDGIFLGVGAWAVAALVHATGLRPGSRSAITWSLVGGALGGLGLFLTYGLVVLGAVPLAVIVARRRADVAAIAAAGASAIVVAFAASGFWWWDGLTATRLQYALSVARSRPYAYYLVANLAACCVALGPAVVAAVPRLRDRRLWLLVGGGLAAILVADVSGLSKAEVERIWLPFLPWIAVATAIYRDREITPWLGAQIGWGLAVQLLVRSPW
jgi:hypothetical protein